MSPPSAQTDLLAQLAQTPFLDRTELAALSGWSPTAVYSWIARLERAGLVEHLLHASPSTAATRRYCLSAAGVRLFVADAGIGLSRALAQHPVSNEWRRLLLQRLDTAALLYRIAVEISESEYPLRFRWYRAQPVDAAVELPDSRWVALTRVGRTANRTSVTERLHRLYESLGIGTVLIVPPDETRLRQSQRIVSRQSAMSFLALERQLTSVEYSTPIWRPPVGHEPLSLRETLNYSARRPPIVSERPLQRQTLPKPMATHERLTTSPAGRRALDLLSDWPWLTPSNLAALMDIGQRRLRQVLAQLDANDLLMRHRFAGSNRLTLSDQALASIARRDRTSVGDARKRWSASSLDSDQPFAWRNITGARSRQLLRHLDHTESVHRFIAQFARQTAEAGFDLVQLDPPQRASRYFRLHGAVRSVQPDAFISVDTDQGARTYFLEYERRAVRPATMKARLAPYLRYYSTRRPLEDHGSIPNILVVLESELAVPHFIRVAEQETSRAGVDLPLLVSHQRQVAESGPLAPIWQSPRHRGLLRPHG